MPNAKAALSPAVLSRLYLQAVLPCLADLSEQDPAVGRQLGDLNACIVLGIMGGPAATLRFSQGRIAYSEGAAARPSARLLFLSSHHLNAFFSGKKWAVPIPVWGGWRVRLLARFSAIAATLEAVLNGEAATLATAEGRRLHARLSLIAAGLGLRPLAEGDAQARDALSTAPQGLACFTIRGETGASVWFEHACGTHAAGWGEPPRRPDVSVAFADIDVAYAAMRDEIDTMAALGTGHIEVAGLVPLADGLNVAMERLRVYLQPPHP
jgi:hypothetical protein